MEDRRCRLRAPGRWRLCRICGGERWTLSALAPGIEFSGGGVVAEAVFTVWHNVFQRGRLQAGERFLVHGGSSGIGLTAIQLVHVHGARAFATAGSGEKCLACEEAGAERAINYRDEDFETALKAEGVDVILYMVGGDYVAKNLKLLRPDGRLVFINAVNGARAEFNAQNIMARRLTITGSTLRSRENAFKSALAAEVERHVWPLIEAGKFRAISLRPFGSTKPWRRNGLWKAAGTSGKLCSWSKVEWRKKRALTMTWPTLFLCDPCHYSKSRHPFFAHYSAPRPEGSDRPHSDINHPFPHPHTVETLIRTGLDGQMSATVEKQFPINQCVYHAALALCLAAAATAGCRLAAA